MNELDLAALMGQADRDLLVQGMQALHAQRVAAWSAQNSYAHRSGQVALNQAAFSIDEAVTMLRRLGAGPSIL